MLAAMIEVAKRRRIVVTVVERIGCILSNNRVGIEEQIHMNRDFGRLMENSVHTYITAKSIPARESIPDTQFRALIQI